MRLLDKRLSQYLSDFDKLYYPSILCTREDLSAKGLLSSALKETLKEIRTLLNDEVFYQKYVEDVLIPRTHEILEQHSKLLKENKL